MKRAILTGAGGFVGHHLLEHLLVNTDWEIIATDSFRHQGKTDRIAEVLAAHPDQAHRVEVITHDLTAPFSAQMTRRIGHVDYLAAVASESHVDRSIADPVPFVRNNTDVMLNTLELARVIKPGVVLHVSTDEVYGPSPSESLRTRNGTRSSRHRRTRRPRRHRRLSPSPGGAPTASRWSSPT